MIAVSALVLAWAGVTPALATNLGSESGNATEACAVVWDAAAVLDLDLNNTQDGGGLMVGLDGTPVDGYSNGGYQTIVHPELGDPGFLEINHWYNGPTSPTTRTTTGSWRIPVATDHTILNATMVVRLPANAGGYTFDPVSMNSRIGAWGAPYGDYTWAQRATQAPVGSATDTVRTINLGTLAAGTGTVFQFNFSVPAGTVLTDPLYATAQLTGTYIQGAAPGCAVTVPPAPVVTPAPCQVELAGQTVFPVTAPDITVRDKWDDFGAIHLTNDPADPTDDLWRTSPTPEGEINADGWGSYPSRTFRLYGATEVDLTGVDIVFTAAQGFTFSGAASAVLTASASGMGGLYAAGYTVAATGIGVPVVTADTITLHIDSMPANSGFAFAIGSKTDGSGQAYVINSILVGDKVSCPGSVAGTVFWDLDSDGALDAADDGVGGYTVTLTDAAGVAHTTTTAADGTYLFDGLEPGDYTVSVELVDPWTGITTVQSYDVAVERGGAITERDFGLIQPGSLSGTVFWDKNADGVNDAGDAPIGSYAVTVTGPDGTTWPLTTDAEGHYSLDGLPAGDYTVTVTLTDPYTGATTETEVVVTVPQGGSGEADFGLIQPGSIAGVVFFDLDNDGLIDGTDVPVGSYQVQLLDAEGNVIATAMTGPDGSYLFEGVPAGEYQVAITLVSPYTGASTPLLVAVTVPQGERVVVNFGLTKPAGPAPTPTPTPTTTPQIILQGDVD